MAKGRLASATVGRWCRMLRADRRWNQVDLAERMRSKGHATWSRATVSEIERGGRAVTVDEMVDLAALFARPAEDLLVPPDSVARP